MCECVYKYINIFFYLTQRILLSTLGSMKLLDDWIALQLLAVFAGASAVTGVIPLVTYARASNEKDLCHGGMVAGSWLLSGKSD